MRIWIQQDVALFVDKQLSKKTCRKLKANNGLCFPMQYTFNGSTGCAGLYMSFSSSHVGPSLSALMLLFVDVAAVLLFAKSFAMFSQT